MCCRLSGSRSDIVNLGSVSRSPLVGWRSDQNTSEGGGVTSDAAEAVSAGPCPAAGSVLLGFCFVF